MTINNISGLNQYINPQTTETANSQTSMATQHSPEQSTAGLNSKSLDQTQQAFKIDITHKAKELYAANNANDQASAEAESKLPVNNTNNNGGQQAARIINLVA